MQIHELNRWRRTDEGFMDVVKSAGTALKQAVSPGLGTTQNTSTKSAGILDPKQKLAAVMKEPAMVKLATKYAKEWTQMPQMQATPVPEAVATRPAPAATKPTIADAPGFNYNNIMKMPGMAKNTQPAAPAVQTAPAQPTTTTTTNTAGSRINRANPDNPNIKDQNKYVQGRAGSGANPGQFAKYDPATSATANAAQGINNMTRGGVAAQTPQPAATTGIQGIKSNVDVNTLPKFDGIVDVSPKIKPAPQVKDAKGRTWTKLPGGWTMDGTKREIDRQDSTYLAFDDAWRKANGATPGNVGVPGAKAAGNAQTSQPAGTAMPLKPYQVPGAGTNPNPTKPGQPTTTTTPATGTAMPLKPFQVPGAGTNPNPTKPAAATAPQPTAAATYLKNFLAFVNKKIAIRDSATYKMIGLADAEKSKLKPQLDAAKQQVVAAQGNPAATEAAVKDYILTAMAAAQLVASENTVAAAQPQAPAYGQQQAASGNNAATTTAPAPAAGQLTGSNAVALLNKVGLTAKVLTPAGQAIQSATGNRQLSTTGDSVIDTMLESMGYTVS